MEIITKNPQETQKLAEKIAKDLLKKGRSKEEDMAIIIALEGDLGGGKTTFVQGFVKGLRVKEKILSPTFVLVKRFILRPAFRQRLRRGEQSQGDKIKNKNFSNFYHIDCYRIKNSREILDLNFEEIIRNPRNIVIIEWADRIKEILPKKRINIRFEWIGEKERRIKISN